MSQPYFYLFQVCLENSINIGKISNLPIIISKVITIFDKSENIEKFCVGPTLASPGPILLRVATVAVKFVVKSKLSRLIMSKDTAKIAI